MSVCCNSRRRSPREVLEGAIDSGDFDIEGTKEGHTPLIIAAINGACAGGGMGQAMNCDMRFAAEGATFSTAFARRGLIAEWGISWALPRVVGTAVEYDRIWGLPL